MFYSCPLSAVNCSLIILSQHVLIKIDFGLSLVDMKVSLIVVFKMDGIGMHSAKEISTGKALMDIINCFQWK